MSDLDAPLTALIEAAMTAGAPDAVVRALIRARVHYRRWARMRSKEPT